MLQSIKYVESDGSIQEINLNNPSKLYELFGVTSLPHFHSYSDAFDWSKRRVAKLKKWLHVTERVNATLIRNIICDLDEDSFNSLYQKKQKEDPDYAKFLKKVRKLGSLN